MELPVKNWKTTLWAFVLPLLYGMKALGVDLHGIELPPLETVWPVIVAMFGHGILAGDAK